MISASARLIIETGLGAAIVTSAIYVAILGSTIESEARTNDLQSQRIEFLEKELIRTREQMIEQLTRIETKLAMIANTK